MTKIKLIALDLDGTTLRARSVLSEANKACLEEAIQRGVHVVIATGRTFTALPEAVFQIRGLEYVITSNGAYVTRIADMQNIYSNYASEEAIESVGRLLLSYREYPIEVFIRGRAYIDTEVFEDVQKNGSDYMDADYIIKTRTPIAGIYDFLLENKGEIENINIHFRELEDRARMKEILETYHGITVTSSMSHNLELGGETTSKADAIDNLCRLLEIGRENVMAMGDSLNDLAMIRSAGIGVAMGNAGEDVKKAADFVTLTNEEDGVAFAVKRFVL